MGQGALSLGGWRIDEGGHLTIEIAIPFNASARVVLPGAHMGEISINGHQLHEGEPIGDSVELTLGAGRHKIEYLFREKDIQTQRLPDKT